jgi:sirohydrochlorin cobaltochelatase
MKRYRHYSKDKAIILSCFGSIIEQNKYFELKNLLENKFLSFDIFLSFSSRMVLKDLQKKNIVFKNLAQILADVDMLGYRNIIVTSINLFPTDEHQFMKKIVEGFKTFSLANIRATNAILTKTKETSLFLQDLNKKITVKNRANLFVIHGCPTLEVKGLDSISYTEQFLKTINSSNYICSLEGAFPFYAIKNNIINKMKIDGIKEVQIIPMLLVSGNHYLKDMYKIKNELSSYFTSQIIKSQSKSDKFNLIELNIIKDIIINNISIEIQKLG